MSLRCLLTPLLASLIPVAIAQDKDLPAGDRVYVSAGELSGWVLDNVANAQGQGSGFHPLRYAAFPETPIFRPEIVGLNFEHIFNGAAADRERSMFTPRKDRCVLRKRDESTAVLHWPAAESSWDMGCTLTYTLSAPNAIDLSFECTPQSGQYPLGYAAFMWASYMGRTRERAIHFQGTEGDAEGWVAFGEDQEEGFETGAVGFEGTANLPYEADGQSLNVLSHPTKRFSEPFYYGLLDGDQNLATTDDTLAYIMMFDQSEPIRFALWNFIRDDTGKADPHSPAWDWQFIIRDPEPGKTYRYQARVVIKPFAGRDDVAKEFAAWAR